MTQPEAQAPAEKTTRCVDCRAEFTDAELMNALLPSTPGGSHEQ